MENPASEVENMAIDQDSTGVDQDRGMREEKRNDDRPAEDGTLNSGRPAPAPMEEIYLQRLNDFQPQEGSAKGARESDLFIVVRDGNTDHTASHRYAGASTAKERAGMQGGQCTHVRGTNILDNHVSRTLSALGTKAEKDPKHRYRSLARLLDRQMLAEAFRKLKRRAAPGIDGVSHDEYAENLDENLLDLVSRLKDGTYRAQPVKRRWIAKAGSRKMRPLGIPVLEDKIVQQAVRMILEPAEEKSALVKFNRWEPESSGKFTFLGFDFHWQKSRRNPNYRTVKRSTNAKKIRTALAALKDWLKKSRSLPLPEIIATLKRKLSGHWNYYGVIGNSDQTWRFAYWAKLMVYKWLNRRSQRKSFNVTTFVASWERWQIPMPRTVEEPLPLPASQSPPRPV